MSIKLNKNDLILQQLTELNTVMENVFRSMKKDFQGKGYPMLFLLDITNGTTAFTLFGTTKTFPFNYYLESIALLNETNALASCRIEVAGIQLPQEVYLISSTADYTASTAQGFLSDAVSVKVYPVNRLLPKPFDLKLYGINTHSVTQTVYILFNGYILTDIEAMNQITKKELILP